MEGVIGIRANNFTMLMADMTSMHSVILMKRDEKKIYPVSNNIAMAVVGTEGDTHQFAEYIVKNVQLYKMRNGYELNPKAAAHFTRQNLADYLRSSTPYRVHIIMGGYDQENGGQLFFLDDLASYKEVPYCGHGYGGMFGMSILDKYCHENMSVEGAYEVMEKCVAELQKRLVINLPNFYVVIVDKDGIRELDRITPLTVAAKFKTM
uniref:Proteasome subunit beta n=1 Tax=Panstrongylus megistus TaxID=65343 RepID=A0A069DX72_9HEMI